MVYVDLSFMGLAESAPPPPRPFRVNHLVVPGNNRQCEFFSFRPIDSIVFLKFEESLIDPFSLNVGAMDY